MTPRSTAAELPAQGFLRFKNWKRYQNADLAKKSSSGVLPWVKLWTHDDYHLSQQTYAVRLLFIELLKLAGKDATNAISNDMNWISSRVDMPPEDVREGVAALLEMGCLSHSKTNRRSRVVSRKNSRPEVEVEVDKDLSKAVMSSSYDGTASGSVIDIRELIKPRHLEEAS